MKATFLKKKLPTQEEQDEMLEEATEEIDNKLKPFAKNHPGFDIHGKITLEDWLKGRNKDIETQTEHFEAADVKCEGFITR